MSNETDHINGPATTVTEKTTRVVNTGLAILSLYGKAIVGTVLALVALVAMVGLPTRIPETSRVDAGLWTRMWMKPNSTVAKNHLMFGTQVDRDFGKHGVYRLTTDDKGYIYRKVAK